MRSMWRAQVQRYPDLFFWPGFLALSALLFLPLYLLNSESSTLLPPRSLFDDGLRMGVNRLLLWRDNLDPVRLPLEFTVLLALWSNLRWFRRPAWRALIVVLYLLALVYACYEAVVVSIYHLDPVFYSQYFLARDGLPFLASHLQNSGWLYLGLGGLLVVALWLIGGAVPLLLESAAQARLHWWTRLSLATLAGLGLWVGLRYQYYTARPEMVVSSLAYKLEENIAASLRLRHDIASFDDSQVRRAYDYTPYQLQQKPNIYLIFIESYGSVLYKRTDFRRFYLALLAELETQLRTAGWQSATALSESPTWGGGSWMAYTSLLFGLRIDSHPQYLALLNKYQVEQYPNLGRYLQSQGYYYAWVSSIADELDDQMWAKYVRFLGVNEWLRYRDLNYHGARFGWGPAPPDQYTLNYANELLHQRTKQPLLFVTLTQNSHFPWTPQPHLVADWHSLSGNEPAAQPAEVSSADLRQAYTQAIRYQLQMLVDFVLNNGDERSLFVFVGDHQPPRVSRRADGWATPIHIISRDPALIERLTDYGFSPGLRAQTLTPSLHHEGVYSLLMRLLLVNDGAQQTALPTYLPNGVAPAASAAHAAN